MKERPILFSGPMVRAILDGRKTMTRRVVKPQPPKGTTLVDWNTANKAFVPWNWQDNVGSYVGGSRTGDPFSCPYGQPGDLLWVKEAWRSGGYDPSADWSAYQIFYRADGASRSMPFDPGGEKEPKPDDGKWRPPIFIPKWACRLRLRVTDVRVERLQEISEADAAAEGVRDAIAGVASLPNGEIENVRTYRTGFVGVWNSINAKRGFGWEVNPFVWRISFEQIEQT